jgi:hypothetical protein
LACTVTFVRRDVRVTRQCRSPEAPVAVCPKPSRGRNRDRPEVGAI